MSKKNVYSCVGISSYVQPDNWNNWNVYAGYPVPNTTKVKKEKVSEEAKQEAESEVLVLPAITEETNESEVVKTEVHVNVNNTVESITQEIVITDENNTTIPDSPEVPVTLAATTPVPAEYYESHFDSDDKEIAVETVESEKSARKPGRPSIKVETENKSVEKQTKKKGGRK